MENIKGTLANLIASIQINRMLPDKDFIQNLKCVISILFFLKKPGPVDLNAGYYSKSVLNICHLL